MGLRRFLLSCAALGSASMLFSVQCAHAAAPRHFAPDDVERIVSLTSPQISPDGKRAVVVVTRIDGATDDYERELELIDLRTHERRPLTYLRKGLSDPAFSPDGTRIAFLAEVKTEDDGKSQIYVLRLDGGDARPVSDAPEGVEQFAWRPDGAAFAYVAEDERPKKSAAQKFADSFVVANNPITATEAARPLHVWTLPLESGAARQLTKDPVRSVVGGEAQGALSWSPDGKTLAFALAPDPVLDDASRARIALLDTASGTTRYLTDHTGSGRRPALFARGRSHRLRALERRRSDYARPNVRDGCERR